MVTPNLLHEEIQIIAEKFKVVLTTEKQELLINYLKILTLWNQRMNLTGASQAEEIVRDHFPDSFAMATLIPPTSVLVDIGSGGGLPAIPFAVLRPDCQITLVEPRAKRTAFLQAALREIHGQAATVHRKRFEDVAPIPDAFYSSKATFEPLAWLNMALPRCSLKGGVLVFCSTQEENIFNGHRGFLQNVIRYQTQRGAARRILLFSSISPTHAES